MGAGGRSPAGTEQSPREPSSASGVAWDLWEVLAHIWGQQCHSDCHSGLRTIMPGFCGDLEVVTVVDPVGGIFSDLPLCDFCAF